MTVKNNNNINGWHEALVWWWSVVRKRNEKLTRVCPCNTDMITVIYVKLTLTEIPDVASTLMMSVISWVDSTISSNTGMLPATNPVFPPWGTTARRRELQYLSTADTSFVVFGRSTNWLLPEVTNTSRSVITRSHCQRVSSLKSWHKHDNLKCY